MYTLSISIIPIEQSFYIGVVLKENSSKDVVEGSLMFEQISGPLSSEWVASLVKNVLDKVRSRIEYLHHS